MLIANVCQARNHSHKSSWTSHCVAFFVVFSWQTHRKCADTKTSARRTTDDTARTITNTKTSARRTATAHTKAHGAAYNARTNAAAYNARTDAATYNTRADAAAYFARTDTAAYNARANGQSNYTTTDIRSSVCSMANTQTDDSSADEKSYFTANSTAEFIADSEANSAAELDKFIANSKSEFIADSEAEFFADSEAGDSMANSKACGTAYFA